jgi:ribosomal-protein-alanine N-acetyltransferase
MELDRVETDRLVGCRPLARDAEELYEVIADPRVTEWLWAHDPAGPTPAKIRTMLVRDMDHWKRHRFGPWIVRDRATHELIGRIGIESTTVEGADEVELAWLVRAERWGQGLATEMARVALDAGLGSLALESLVAFTLPGNVGSRRVMEHLGMTYERDIVHVGLLHVLYRARRPNTLT